MALITLRKELIADEFKQTMTSDERLVSDTLGGAVAIQKDTIKGLFETEITDTSRVNVSLW